MYLSALTLKGFKSFASATTLRLEPGMTCVVGPNGSGKSNVVDAIAWVLGEQGARSLRGGSMADVIFAGTSARPALGRAEVSVTFDNSDGAMAEGAGDVTVTRTMFRSGGSEYAINGRACRLLDIQDLLGDAGLGRELHVLVGQGRVDAVLAATPQERRLFLEEAAGVAKHRRRKDKALRKLAAMDSNLVRLADLTSEVARQLKPLGRQARTAQRARRFASDARDARLRLLADDVATAHGALAALDPADGVATQARLTAVEADLARAESARHTAQDELSRTGPAVQDWRTAATRAAAVHERLRTVIRLAEDRLRLLDGAGADLPGPDAEGIDAEAGEAAAEVVALTRELAAAHDEVRSTGARRREVEAAHAGAERDLTRRSEVLARAREQVTRAQADLAAARARLDATHAEAARLAEAVTAAAQRLRQAETDLPEDDPASAAAPAAVAERLVVLRRDHDQATDAARRSVDEERAAERELAGARARVEALAAGIGSGAGSDVVAAHLPDAVPVAAELDVEPGLEAAVAAVLGDAATALSVRHHDEALPALAAVTRAAAGRVTVVIADAGADAGADADADADGDAAGATRPRRRPGTTGVPLAAAVRGRGAVARWARGRLAGAVLVEDPRQAVEVVRRPGGPAVAVTRAGETASRDLLRAGTGEAEAALRRRSDLAAARAAVEVLHERVQTLAAAAAAAAAGQAAAATARAAAEEERTQALAAAAAQAQRRSGLHAAVETARRDLRRAQAALAASDTRREDQTAEVERRAALLDTAAAQAERAHAGSSAGPDTDTADLTDLADQARQAREAETGARLTARALEERVAAARRRAEAVAARAAATHRAIAAAHAEGVRRRAARVAAAEVHEDAADALATARHLRDVTAAELARHEADHGRAQRGHGEAMQDAQRLGAERARLTEILHAEELARTERRLRLESLAHSAMADHGFTVDALVDQYGPHVPVPVLPEHPVTAVELVDDPAEARAGSAQAPSHQGSDAPVAVVAYDRAEQTRRLREAERSLTALGSINPLAMEEYSALEERHRFLLQQQQDLTDSKRDLLSIIRDVDERVEQVIGEAFADTAHHFAEVIPRLFPGGSGRLQLSDPDDLLESGLEIEARPAGKAVKRLSLLSGGERTLVALAFLVALFRARPSPFYVLDEIEAALDDTNLQRLLTLLDELRQASQLIVVTHQRRTMEHADALYGVAMRDGVTTLVSQRLRGAEGVADPAA